MTVGIPRTPYFIGVCGFSSMLTLATVNLPAMSAARSSRKGPIILQGPHHSAQKSTRTGPLARSTSASKLLSVTAIGFIRMFLRLTRAEIRGAEKATSRRVTRKGRRTDRHQPRAFRPQQGTADLASGINAGKRRSIDCQLPQIKRRDRLLGSGWRTQGFVIDDQHAVFGDDEPIDLRRYGMAGPCGGGDQADERHLGVRTRSEQRREIGVAQHRQGLAPDLLLLADGKAVYRQCQKSLRCDFALRDRQFGQGLQQSMDEKTALEAVASRCGKW